MDNSLLTRSLWIAGSGGNMWLFCVLLLKHWWRRFPLFTTLAGYEVFRAVLLFLTVRLAPWHTYFLTYWISEAADILLQLAILWELVTASLGVCNASAPAMLKKQPWTTIVVVAVLAAMCSWFLPSAGEMKETVDMRVSLFTSVLTCELFVVISVLMNRLGVRRSRHVMAISQGLAVWAVLSIGSDVIHQLSGWEQHSVGFDQLQSIGIVLILAYWIHVFSNYDDFSQSIETLPMKLSSPERASYH